MNPQRQNERDEGNKRKRIKKKVKIIEIYVDQDEQIAGYGRKVQSKEQKSDRERERK